MSAKILVLGDWLRDLSYVVVPKETFEDADASYEVIQFLGQTYGGAGLVASNLRALGYDVSHPSHHMAPGYLDTKIRYFLDDKIVARFDIPSPTTTYKKGVNLNCIANQPYKAIVLSDYNKGCLPPEDGWGRVVELARESKCNVIHTKRDPIEFSSGLDIEATFFCNKREFNAFKLEYLHLSMVNTVVVTDGSKGCFSINDRVITTYEATKCDPKCIVGAGDAFMAGWVNGQLLGLPFADIVATANVCAASAISQPYVTPLKATQDYIDVIRGINEQNSN